MIYAPLPSFDTGAPAELSSVSPFDRNQEPATGQVVCLLLPPGRGHGVLDRLMLGGSLMCLPGQQIRLGSGTRTPK